MNVHAGLLKAEFLAVSPSSLHFVALLSWLFHHLLTASVSKFSVHNNSYKETIYFFNWRVIVLQCCGGLCSTSTWISHHYIYIHTYISPPSCASLPPHPTPLCYTQAPCVHRSCLCYLWAPCVTPHLPTGYLFYIWQCLFATLSVCPTLSSTVSSSVDTVSILYIWISVSSKYSVKQDSFSCCCCCCC